MKQISLFPYFALAFFYHLALPSYSGIFPVLYFAPFFSVCFCRLSFFSSLWISFFVGFFLDMCTVSTPMGFYPVCGILTTLAIYRFRVYFTEDKPFPFSLYTGLYSFIYTIAFMFLHSFYDTKFTISILPFLTDIIFLPMLDTIYHLSLFTLPISIYLFLISRKSKVFFLKMKRLLLLKISTLKKVKAK